MTDSSASFWTARARREARRFNAGWVLQSLLPVILWGGLVAAVLILGFRTLNLWEGSTALAILLGFALAGALSIWKTREKFLSREEALVRLDAELKLHNALTCASAGVLPWPTPQTNARLPLEWNLPTLGWPFAVSLLAIFAALLIPLPQGQALATNPTAEPGSWSAVDTRLEELKTEDLVEPEAIEELESALEALRSKPEKEWFSHESLEAGDHLQESTEAALAEMQKNLEAALGAMEVSRQLESAQLAALSPALEKSLQEALQNLASGAMPLDEAMLSKLQGLNPESLRELSAEQWKEIQQKLKDGISTCSQGECSGEEAGESLLMALASGRDGAKFGQGGVSRGPGAAPLTLSDSQTQLGTQSRELLKNEDLSRAALGDLMGLGTGEHQPDESAAGSAGRFSKVQGAGEAVTGVNATPAEQKVLQTFFQ